MGPAVEDDVALLFLGELGEVLAKLLGAGLVGVAGHGLGDLGADAGAGDQAGPAVTQVHGGLEADALGPEPAEDRGDHHDPQVLGQEAVQGRPDDEQDREETDDQQDGRAQQARPVALTLLFGDEGAQLEGAEPDQDAGQEEQPEDRGDHGEPGVALLAYAVGGEAVLDDGLRLGAEGLDDLVAPAAQHPQLHGPGEGLAEPRLEEGDLALAERGGGGRGPVGLRLVRVECDELLDRLVLLVAVRGRRERLGRGGLPVRAAQRDLGPGRQEVEFRAGEP